MSPFTSRRVRRTKMSYAASLPFGLPLSVTNASVCTWTLTFSVAPSIGMGTLVAYALGASKREVARRAFRVAFIGDPFRVSLRNEGGVSQLPSARSALYEKRMRLCKCLARNDRVTRPVISLHAPAVAHDDRLARQRVRRERGQEQSHLRDVRQRGELAVHRVLEHQVLDHFLFSDS